MVTEQQAVIWDLDGVIVDSAEAHNYSWAAMALEYGVPFDPVRDFPLYFGRHNTDIIMGLWNITDPVQIERMANRKEALFRDAARAIKPLPGVEALIEALAKTGWKQGIGSSAPLENVQLLLSVTHLGKYMDAIASGADVTVGKPDPTVFLLAFERLRVQPQDGVVIEDAPAGVVAAKAAGAACLAVTNTRPATVLRDAGAGLVVDTLEGLTPSDLENLIHQNLSHPR